MPGAVIIGAGPGIGRSVALRFAREAMPVALIARNGKTVHDVADAVSALGVPTASLTAGVADEAALRAALDGAVVTLLDQQYGPSGVHVATVTVGGPVTPGTNFDPDDIAEHYWPLHTQARHEWERETLYAGAQAERKHGHGESGQSE